MLNLLLEVIEFLIALFIGTLEFLWNAIVFLFYVGQILLGLAIMGGCIYFVVAETLDGSVPFWVWPIGIGFIVALVRMNIPIIPSFGIFFRF
ncbi:MAG: hypothetical protein ACPG06_10525 [Alphaproteobacteria bacterium]